MNQVNSEIKNLDKQRRQKEEQKQVRGELEKQYGPGGVHEKKNNLFTQLDQAKDKIQTESTVDSSMIDERYNQIFRVINSFQKPESEAETFSLGVEKDYLDEQDEIMVCCPCIPIVENIWKKIMAIAGYKQFS